MGQRLLLTLWALFVSVVFCFAQKSDLNSTIRRADSFVGKGQYEQALELLDSIEKECLESKDSITIISYLFIKAVGTRLSGEIETSISLFERICLFYRELGPKDATYLSSLSSIGGMYFEKRDFEISERYFRKTIISCLSAFVSEEIACNYLSEAYSFLHAIYKELDNGILQEECLRKLEEIDRWKKTKTK